MKMLFKIIPVLLVAVFLPCLGPATAAPPTPPPDTNFASATPPPDLKWFREQMGIAPQYQEQSPGLGGISWPHFLVMAFLAAFFVVALVAVFLRNRRTRQILLELLKEESCEAGQG